MARGNFQRTEEPQRVPLWLSLSIEADYRNLSVFPGLRLERASKRSGTLLLFHTPSDFAREVLEHALARMQEIGGGRGIYQAYRATVAKLRAALDAFDGVQDDPGQEAYEAELRSIGTHAAGARLTDLYGDEVVIGSGYGLYKAHSADGSLRDENGRRFNYRPGYLGTVKAGDGEVLRFFYPAGELLDAQGRATHLRLVNSSA